MHQIISGLLNFISAHSYLSYGAVFLISLSESLAIIGLVIPGTVIMFGIGAVITTGSLSLLPVLAFAAAGAIAGDGISYWLGRRYRDRLRGVWPFSRYPAILHKGEEFFHKHSRKSVILGRFVGPVRPVIPVVAGMMGMPPLSFTVVNVVSAIAWANVYILPGVLLGASISVAKAVSTRLAVLLIIVLGFVWIAFWLIKRAVRFFEVSWPAIYGRVVKWAEVQDKKHPVRRLIRFFMRRKGEEFLFIFLALVSVAALWGFLGILQDVTARDPLVIADRGIYLFFRSLRTAFADNFFVAVTELGDSAVNLPVFAAVLLFLAVKKHVRAAVFWTAAAVCGVLSVELLKYGVHLQRPVSLYQGASAYSFPSGHTAMSTIIYGFSAILLVRSVKGAWRWLLPTAVLFITFMIGFSRLYLGAHWFSDVAGGFLAGTFWVTLLGITYLKKTSSRIPAGAFILAFCAVLLTAGLWHINKKHGNDLSFYRVRSDVQRVSFDSWLASDWQKLPVWRVDMEGEHEQPFTVQYAGDIDALRKYLTADGWQTPPALGVKSVMGFLSPSVPAEVLPVLPRLHGGMAEKLLLVRYDGTKRWELRLWLSAFDISGSGAHIYIGTVEEQELTHKYWLFGAFSPSGDYVHSLEKLTAEGMFKTVTAVRPPSEIKPDSSGTQFIWNGGTVLISEK